MCFVCLFGFVLSVQPNSCNVSVKGSVFVSFGDNSKYEFSLPQLHISGLLWGSRTFTWKGPLAVEGPQFRCTLMVGGGPDGGLLDEVFGKVQYLQNAEGPQNSEQGPTKGAPEIQGIITGSYTDRLYWNEEE